MPATAARYPFDVEPASTIFCRLLLRVAVAAGVVVALLAWGIYNAATFSMLMFLLVAIVAAVHGCSVGGRADAMPVVLLAGEVALSVLAALGVIAMAGGPGILLTALCLGLSERVRARLRCCMKCPYHNRFDANRGDAWSF
jgi:hypothetical protein